MTAAPTVKDKAPTGPSAAALDRPGLQALVQAFLSRAVSRGGGSSAKQGGGGGGGGLVYEPARASAWAASLAGELRDEVRAFLGGPTARHKVIAHVSVTQRAGQGTARSAGCLWAAGGGGNVSGGGVASASASAATPDTDGCGWATAENDEVGVVAEVYALYVH
jgi:hypothetical protein